jgi:hypothetical protein
MREILEMLKIDNHFNQSEYIEIAKGKYEIPTTLKQAVNKSKRILKWKQR